MRSAKKIECLPDQLIQEILSTSPVKSLIQSSCVSNAWRNLITDTSFINLHLNRSIQRNKFSLLLSNSDNIYSIHDPMSTTTTATTKWPFPYGHESHNYYDVVGSCNGLLLIIPNRGCLGIWNPSTGDFICIPSPCRSLKNYTVFLPLCDKMYGFGYGSNRSDYKIVSIDCGAAVEIRVFSMQSRSWKTIEGSNIDNVGFNTTLYTDSDGIFVNGAVHWLGSFFYTKIDKVKRVIAFDLGCEEFRKIPLPDHLKNSNEYSRLSIWGESICLFIKDCKERSSHIFVMKEYGVRDSWCKLCTIPEAPIPKAPKRNIPHAEYWSIVCFVDDHKILLQQKGLYNLFLYDTRSDKFVELELHKDIKNFFDEAYCFVCAYIPSLVPIK
ncbi:hypothetical protein Sjap_008492 [Stephania japonica]|uniref:F-box domain-containing protein n=1 Tax=Stephania japonica TaxID=461633 RepID=A0AAP0JR71_9MAGN